MSTGSFDHQPELDEFLSRAVDRQLAEQRALREALNDLRNTVDALSRRPVSLPEFDQAAFDERVIHLASELQAAARDGIESMRAATKSDFAEIHDATRTELAQLREAISSGAKPESTTELVEIRRELAELREALATLLDRPVEPPPLPPQLDLDEVRVIVAEATRKPDDDDALANVREEVATVNANLEGIAAALIDMSAGLRDWASGVDAGIANLTRGVSSVRKMSDAARQAANSAKDAADDARRSAEAASESLALEVAEPDEAVVDAQDERLQMIETRIEETAQLTAGLSKQIENFARSAVSMREVPKTVEAAVAQALKRAMAARAKLDKDASDALDETLGALDEQIDAINDALSNIKANDEQLRKVVLGQVDLSSRIDSLHESLLARLDDVKARRSAEPAASPARSSRRPASPKKSSQRSSRTPKRRSPSAPPEDNTR